MANHLLVISQYFHPETFRINDMAEEWVRRGYKVTVLTGIPNYPMGRTYKGYSLLKKRRERWRGIDIIRIPLIPRGSSSIGMVLNYLSFVISGWFWKTFHDVKADIIFSFEVSPMTQVMVGCWCAKKRNIPHFLYVQDLWPENVETVTGIHSPLVINPINRMVDYIYRNADMIFTTSEPFRKVIINRGVPESKVRYWPQYAEDFYRPVEPTTKKKIALETVDETGGQEYKVARQKIFRVAFTGNIGTAQGLGILPEVAGELKKRDVRVKFVIIGNGRYQGQLMKEIDKRRVGNMFEMIPKQPAEKIPNLMANCDAAFLSFADTRLWEMTIPAKLQSYMACGMPIIAAAKGETRRIIEEANCGICVDIGDRAALAEAIQDLARDSRRLDEMRENSLEYCRIHFNKKTLMDEMDQLLRSF